MYLTPESIETKNRSTFLDIARSLSGSDVVFDIGANIGLYTWEVAGLCPELVVVAFEPDPENGLLLERTWKLAGNSKTTNYWLVGEGTEAERIVSHA